MSGTDQTSQLSEIAYLRDKVQEARLPSDLKEKIDGKLKRLRRVARQGSSSEEYESVAKYIDTAVNVPWGRYVRDNTDLNVARQILDSNHYGSDHVKDTIMEYLALMKRKTQNGESDYAAPALAFVGVQGAGKTSLAKAIAKSLGRPFYRLSLGALASGTELRGSPSSSVNGSAGRILRALIKSKCMNPVILLDEFDKISGRKSDRSDFMAILLEILDPGQNSSFRDIYLDHPADLSKVLFIATANRFQTITRELLDRLEFIEFHDYSAAEKAIIAQRYLMPKVYKYSGLKSEELIIKEDAWPILVQAFGSDNGVRRLEQNLQELARRVLKAIYLGSVSHVEINASNAAQFTKQALPAVDDIRHNDYTVEKGESYNTKQA